MLNILIQQASLLSLKSTVMNLKQEKQVFFKFTFSVNVVRDVQSSKRVRYTADVLTPSYKTQLQLTSISFFDLRITVKPFVLKKNILIKYICFKVKPNP